MRGRGWMLALLALAAVLVPAHAALAAPPPPLPHDLPAYGPDRPLPALPVAESRTPEGLTVWVAARPGFPKLTAVLAVRGGRAADPADLPGLSDLLARTVKEGTARRSARQVADEVAAAGGRIASSADEDAISVTVDGLAGRLAPLLDVLADVARHPAFSDAEVALARDNALGDLQATQAEAGFAGTKAFAAALYGSHPYRVTAPTEASIRAVTPAILRREYARRFRPDRALLVLVGDLDAAAAARQAAAAFAGWHTSGDAAPPTPPAPATAAPVLDLVPRPNSVQSLILVGSPMPREGDPDYYPLLVANAVFGGTFGSRMVTNLREDKGYTYSPFSSLQSHAAGAHLQVHADVRNEVTGASLNEILYELTRMATTTPTEAELSTAKRYLTGIYMILSQQQRWVASTLADNWIGAVPDPRNLGAYITRVSAVTLPDVVRVSRTHLAARRQLIVVVGDAARVKADLEVFGPVTEVKP